jgi:hypothetical protein
MFLFLFLLSACKSDYEKMVTREMAKPGRQDSIFLGIEFGMTSKDFFAHCWELNKQGLIRQGSQNTTVMYELKDFKDKASMNFYPTFIDGEVREMPVTFAYENWAPWNKGLVADSLLQEVMPLMEEWYGKGFLKMEHPTSGDIYVRQDKNRRITVKTDKERFVNVMFTDLSVDVKAAKEKIKQEALEAQQMN